MATPLSAAAAITADLDSLVQFATLLAGSQESGEQLVRQVVVHLLPRWKDLGEEPSRQVRHLIAQRITRQHTHPGREADDPLLAALAALPGHRRVVVVLLLTSDDTELDLSAALHRSVHEIRTDLDRGVAGLVGDRADHPGRLGGPDPAVTNRIAQDLLASVSAVRASPDLRADLLSAAVRADPLVPEVTTPPRRWGPLADRRTLLKVSIGLAAAVLIAAVPVARAVIGGERSSGTAALPEPSSPRTGIVLSPEWRADPAASPGITPMTAELCRSGMLDAGQRRPESSAVIGLCWPIETGGGTVWAAGRLADGSNGASSAGDAHAPGTTSLATIGDPRFYSGQECRSPVQLRPVLLRAAPDAGAAGTAGVDPGPAVTLGCLPADDERVIATLQEAAVSSVWTISQPTARCDPRVSNGLVYQPYRIIAAQDWDLGVICVDSPDDGRPTSFAVLTGDRLASARTIVDGWLKGNGIAFCTGGNTTRPRVALWLAKNDGLGQFQGVFGPNACAMGPAVVSAFRMLADPANSFLATPDLKGLDLDQMVAALRSSGFAET
ncbi:hypothetical protein D1871_13125 [Nakamurella silvestris]|nr:hypothetical protein D1871_13125 [Nakamurella silvestris]